MHPYQNAAKSPEAWVLEEKVLASDWGSVHSLNSFAIKGRRQADDHSVERP